MSLYKQYLAFLAAERTGNSFAQPTQSVADRVGLEQPAGPIPIEEDATFDPSSEALQILELRMPGSLSGIFNKKSHQFRERLLRTVCQSSSALLPVNFRAQLNKKLDDAKSVARKRDELACENLTNRPFWGLYHKEERREKFLKEVAPGDAVVARITKSTLQFKIGSLQVKLLGWYSRDGPVLLWDNEFTGCVSIGEAQIRVVEKARIYDLLCCEILDSGCVKTNGSLELTTIAKKSSVALGLLEEANPACVRANTVFRVEWEGKDLPDYSTSLEDSVELQSPEVLDKIRDGLSLPSGVVSRFVPECPEGFRFKALSEKQDAGMVEKLYDQGIACMSERAFDETIQCFKKALELDLKHVPSYVGLAVVYQETGEEGEALATMFKAYELEPEHPQVPTFLAGILVTLANKLLRQEKIEEGVEFLQKAIEVDPKCQAAIDELQNVRKQLEMAVSACERNKKLAAESSRSRPKDDPSCDESVSGGRQKRGSRSRSRSKDRKRRRSRSRESRRKRSRSRSRSRSRRHRTRHGSRSRDRRRHRNRSGSYQRKRRHRSSSESTSQWSSSSASRSRTRSRSRSRKERSNSRSHHGSRSRVHRTRSRSRDRFPPERGISRSHWPEKKNDQKQLQKTFDEGNAELAAQLVPPPPPPPKSANVTNPIVDGLSLTIDNETDPILKAMWLHWRLVCQHRRRRFGSPFSQWFRGCLHLKKSCDTKLVCVFEVTYNCLEPGLVFPLLYPDDRSMDSVLDWGEIAGKSSLRWLSRDALKDKARSSCNAVMNTSLVTFAEMSSGQAGLPGVTQPPPHLSNPASGLNPLSMRPPVVPHYGFPGQGHVNPGPSATTKPGISAAEERRKQLAEEKRKLEQEERRRKAEKEAARRKEEEDKKRKKEEEERKRKKEEEERKRKKEEEERKRKKEEEERKRKKEEEEMKRKRKRDFLENLNSREVEDFMSTLLGSLADISAGGNENKLKEETQPQPGKTREMTSQSKGAEAGSAIVKEWKNKAGGTLKARSSPLQEDVVSSYVGDMAVKVDEGCSPVKQSLPTEQSEGKRKEKSVQLSEEPKKGLKAAPEVGQLDEFEDFLKLLQESAASFSPLANK